MTAGWVSSSTFVTRHSAETPQQAKEYIEWLLKPAEVTAVKHSGSGGFVVRYLLPSEIAKCRR